MITSKQKQMVVSFLVAALVFYVSPDASGRVVTEAKTQFSRMHPGAKFIASKSSKHFSIVHGFKTRPLMGNIADGARHFIETNGPLFGIEGPQAALVFEKSIPHVGNSYLRFSQHIDALPVFGSKIIAHVDSLNRIVKVSAHTVSDTPNAWTPVLDTIQAHEAVAKYIPGAAQSRSIKLGYFPVQGKPVLSYEVVTQAPGPHTWVSYVDAVSGSILMVFDAVRQSEAKLHKAKVYKENPKSDSDLTEVELPNIINEGEHVNHTYGAYARVASCTEMGPYGCNAWEHFAVATEENGFLDILPNPDGAVLDDGFAEINVYYTLDKQNTWFREEFGFDGQFGDLESEGQGAELADYLWVIVNMDYENGAFAGGYGGGPDSIILGAVYGKDLAYDNDVTVHEFTHAASSKVFSIGMGALDELGIDMSSGGVEEGNADYFAVSTFDNPILGEYSGVSRNADNDKKCPNDLIGESHFDGEIIAGTMWEIRESLGKRKTDHLQYGTLSGHTVNNFEDFGKGLIAQAEWMAKEDSNLAEDLVLTLEDIDVIKRVVEERNLIGCERLVPLPSADEEPVLHYMPFGMTEEGMPSPVQYFLETDENTAKAELFISCFGETNYDILVREAKPVSFEWSGGYPNLAWEAEYDAKWEYNAQEGVPIDVVQITESTEFKLNRGSKYYFSIVCKPQGWGMGGCQNFLTAKLTEGPPPPEEEPDAGFEEEEDAGMQPEADAGADTDTVDDMDDDEDDDEDSKDDSGCDCRTGVDTHAASVSLVQLLQLLF